MSKLQVVNGERAKSNPSKSQKRHRSSTFEDFSDDDDFIISKKHVAEDDGQVEEDHHESEADDDKSIDVRLSDPDLLDCPICFESLTSPVYQCSNGHIACSDCCAKLKRRCATCSMSTGYIRCLALEKILESVKISCPNKKYGCKVTFNIREKNDHKLQCLDAPCSCPSSGCDLVASFRDLYHHFSDKHKASALQFSSSHSFSVTLKIDGEKPVILRENTYGTLFVLCNILGGMGNSVHICCIAPNCMFNYEISAISEGWTLTSKINTETVQRYTAGATPSRFLLIPKEFVGSSDCLKLEILIKC